MLAAPLRAQHDLVALPLEDPAHAQLLGLERLGCGPARVAAFRPYFVGRIRDAIARAREDARCRGPLLDALAARFARDSVRPDTLVIPDSLRGLAADLAAAAAATAATRRQPEASPDGSYVGAALTLRGVAHSEGEFRPLWEGARDIEEGSPPAVAILRLRGTVDGGPRLVGVVEAFGQTNRRNDPLVRSKRLRQTTGVVEFSEAYINGRVGPLLLSLGRAREAWLGEGSESLMLSAHGPAYDRALASATWRRVELRALVASLDDLELTVAQDSLIAGSPSTRVYRWFLGHAIALRPTADLEFTIGETALLTRQTRALEVSYLNPTMVYLVTQNDEGQLDDARDNLGMFGAARWRRGPLTAVGELFLDDFQLDAGDREITPHQLAWRVGARLALPMIAPTSAGLEYRRIDNYTYMRGLYSEAYQQYGRPLGSELGPGADLLEGSVETWLGTFMRLGARGALWRQGALRIDQRPGQRAGGNAGASFPRTFPDRPAVQRAQLAAVEADFLRTRLPISLRLEVANIDNAANQFTPSALYVRALLQGTYAFRYP